MSSYPHKCVKAIVLGDFCGCSVKTNNEPDEITHRIRVAIQQLTAPDETSKLVLMTHYDVIVTSRLAMNI